jgi:nitrile hydratase accessory protein
MNAAHVESARAPLDALPGLPRDAEGPVFEEPWQAHAFAMTLSLHERGVFTWPEWSNALAQQIRSAADHDAPNDRETYYRHWLKALEALLAAKGVASIQEQSRFQEAWRRAAQRTPHGAPIVLADDDLSSERDLDFR